jgi:hypothetical protein
MTIDRSVASGNGAEVFRSFSNASGTTAELSCEDCVSSYNADGFLVFAAGGGSASIRVSHSTATNNDTYGFSQLGTRVFELLGNNTVAGNNNGGAQTDGTITTIAGT